MKLGALFSGGKDSTYALYKALEDNEIVCLISIISENPESYMFHTPNINLCELQAEALGFPLIQVKTKGEKEKELVDLANAIKQAKKEYKIEGVIKGALASEYQASRIKKICDELGLECVNPLWGKDQKEYMQELIDNEFEVMIIGVASDGLGEEWLGKIIDQETLDILMELSDKFGFNPAFEGGEAETLVVNCPIFKKKLKVVDSEVDWEGNCGTFIIREAELV